MTTLSFSTRDAALHPRAGQHVTFDFHGHRIHGRVASFSGNCLRVYPDSFSFLRQLRPDSHLTVTFVTGHGFVEAVASMLVVNDQVLSAQLVRGPVLVQRRNDPRIAVSLEASLVWLACPSRTPLHIAGHTQNLSLGGALLRFATTHPPLPGDDSVTLVGLQLPDGLLPLSARVSQTWDGGARVFFIGHSAQSRTRLSAFVDSRLP
jgi:hypothetical protein